MQEPTTTLSELAKPRASLRDLAREAGLSYSYVTKVAAGARRPNRALREAVERVYGVPAWTVFGDAEAPSRRRNR